MRNLKKALSLALASVMLLGMMVVGTSAAYTDVDSADNVEAIEVMKMAGIMIGDNGKFNPDKNVTRNEMAVIMTNLLGLTPADYAGTSPFTDVPAWAEPYVAAAYANGITGGISATEFGGDTGLTAAQAALMVMKALGYFQYASDFGSDWQLATVKQADKIDLFKDIDAKVTATLTRNDVAQMVLNALKANVVDAYGQDGVKVEGEGFTVTTGSTITYYAETNLITDDYRVAPNTDRDTTEQLVEKLFEGDLKLDINSATDDFGRAGYTWTWKTSESLFVVETPDVTFTAETKAADVAKALAGYKFVYGGNTYKVNNVNEYANNTTLGTYDWTRNTAGTTWSTSLASALKTNAANQTVAERLATLTRNGRVVEVYADKDGIISEIVMIDYKTVEAGKVTTNKTTGDITYIIDGVNYYDYADEDVADTIELVADLKKGDIITFVKDNAGVAHVTPTTSFQAAQSATKTSSGVQTITLDGTAYTVSNFAKSGTTFSNSTTVYNYFVDQYGYIVHTSSTAKASTDYAYVIETEAKVETSALASAAVSLKAKVLLADGTVAVYPVELKKNDAGNYYIKNVGGDSNVIFDKTANAGAGSTTAQATTAAQGDIKGLTFGYTLTDGVITFETLTALPANGSNTAENTVYVQKAADTVNKVTSVALNTDKTALVDANTIFVAYNSTKDEAKVYTGMSALPTAITSLTSANDTYVLKTGTTNKVGTAQVVFFTYAAANHLAADATTDYYFVDNTKYSTVMVDGKNQTQYTAYAADGTTKTLIAASSAPSAAALYTPDKDDKITGSGLSGARYIDATSNKMVDAGEMIGVAGTYYYVTENTQIVYVDSDLTELDDNQAWIVLELDGSTVTSNIETIFVIAD